jgi:hypothetical protein
MSGGVSHLLSIAIGASIGSSIVRFFKGKETGTTQSSPDEEWAVNTIAYMHQVACSCLIPRADRVWRLITKLHNSPRRRWLWITGLILGAYSVSGYLALYAAYYRVYYPAGYGFLVHFAYERPLLSFYWLRRIVRRRFDRLMFIAFHGETPSKEYHALSKSNSEIRLIKSHAGNSWNITKASLLPVSIFRAPPFEAVSYRWSSENQVAILLNNQKFFVSGPVHEMLRGLRYQTEDRLLWIDSLCINQTDDTEKSWQIGLMREILQSADQVIWWLSTDFAIFPPVGISLSVERARRRRGSR